MEKSIDGVQAVINKKAENRLKADLYDLSQRVGSNRLLSHRDDNIPKLYIRKDDEKPVLATIEGETTTQRVFKTKAFESNPIDNMMGVSSSGATYNIYGSFSKLLYDFWLPKYIEEESRAFVKKIAELEEQIEYVSSDISSIQRNEY